MLWELDHALRLASKGMNATLGVTGLQRLVIRLVGRFPGLTAGDLATLLHVDPSTLTGVLERLGRQQLIVRNVDETDRRRALFSLTEDGRRLDRTRKGTVEAAVLRALQGQPRARLASARQVLVAIAKELASEHSD